MSAKVGTGYVDIQGDFTSLNKQISAAFSSSRFGRLGKVAGAGFAAGVAATGALKIAYDLGEAFDDAYDRIRVGTGATGKALKGLERDFKAVIKSVPADFEAASTAVADLNTRLGLTGRPLRRLSKQFTELSRITETDLGENIAKVTRAFGDWQVKTRDQSRTLDFFFRASQASGAEVAALADQVVKFGAPLRQVGFSLEEATTMFASFERAGVNVQTMMPGLRFALKTFLAENRDPKTALVETFEGIEKGTIKASDALAIFGQRAGADMIEAIRQGRFDLDAFRKQLTKSDETIMKAGRDTMDFAEHWQRFKNNVLVALEPVATRVFGLIGEKMGDVADILADPKLSNAERFEKLRDMAVAALSDLVTKAGELAPKVVAALGEGILKAWRDMSPLAKIFTVGALISAVGGRRAIMRAGVALGGILGGGIASGAAASAAAGAAGGAAAGAAAGAAGGGLIGAMREKLLPIAKRVGLVGVGVALVDSIMSEMSRRTQARSGDFLEALKAIGEGGKFFGDDDILGMELPFLRSENADRARALAQEIEQIVASGRKLSTVEADNLVRQLGEIEGLSDEARRAFMQFVDAAADAAEDLERTNRRKLVLREIEHGWSKSLRKMAGISDTELDRIKHLMETKPRKGIDALSDAMRDGVDAIRNAMRDGKISTRKGLQEIHTLLNRELQVKYGISHGDAEKLLKAKKEDASTPGFSGLQQGGLAAVVPGNTEGDRHLLSLDGKPIAKVESKEGIFVGNRGLMKALSAANAAIPRNLPGFQRGGFAGQVVELLWRTKDHYDHLHVALASYRAAVRLGKRLQKMGYAVSEHPAFGGVAPVHTAGSYHYSGQALDVNADHWPGGEMAALDRLYQMLSGGRLAGGLAAKINLPRFIARFGAFWPHATGLNRMSAALERAMRRRAMSIEGAEGIGPKLGALGEFVATSYGPPWGGINGSGITATGVDLRAAPKMFGIAVDPSVIPLGSQVKVWPNPFGHRGRFLAFDTGGAIKGKRIDFYDWRGRKAQMAWGTRTVNVQGYQDGGEIVPFAGRFARGGIVSADRPTAMVIGDGPGRETAMVARQGQPLIKVHVHGTIITEDDIDEAISVQIGDAAPVLADYVAEELGRGRSRARQLAGHGGRV